MSEKLFAAMNSQIMKIIFFFQYKFFFLLAISSIADSNRY